MGNGLERSRSIQFLGGIASKSLVIAALTGLAVFGATNSAQAADVDMSKQPLNTPTLDYLGQNGVIYQKDTNGDGVTNDPLKSGYTLTETTNSSLDNVITKYIYDKASGTLNSQQYELKLLQTEYGNKEGDSAKYYAWKKDETTSNTFGETISNLAQITYKYSESGYNKIATKQVTDLSTADVDNVLFQNISSTTDGGAINNSADNSNVNITGGFIGNYATSSSSYVYGGAIYNNASSSSSTAQIGDITGDFIGNYATSSSSYVYGGAIYNNASSSSSIAQIGNITGDFIGNSAYAYYRNSAYGGAIYNYASSSATAKIGEITGDFIGNYAKSEAGETQGGAIYNDAIIGDITGDFIGNYTSSQNSLAQGGAISNRGYGTITSITGDFIGNYAKSESGIAEGGAIHNFATSSSVAKIGNITGDFIGNYADGRFALGGAIYNYNVTIDDITGAFIDNYALAVTGNAYGGAIYNDYGTIGDITGDFIDNYVQGSTGTRGGAIYNEAGTIGDIIGDFIGNYAKGGAGARGGAIYNTGTFGDIAGDFINNYAKSETGTAQGGAIWTNKDLNLLAKDGHTSLISGNYVEDKDGKRPEAIRLANQTSHTTVGNYAINGTATTKSIRQDKFPIITTLTLRNNTDGKIIINDQIVGEATEYIDVTYYNMTDRKQYVKLNEDGTYHDIETPDAVILNSKLNITGDGTGLVQLNNDVINMDITLDNTTLHLGLRDNVLDNNNLILNSGTLSMINNQVGVSALSSLHLYGTTNFLADVDLAKGEMDRFTTDAYGIGPDAKLNVIGLNILSDMQEDVYTTSILFAENSLKDNVTYGGTELPNSEFQTTAYTPIYKYNVSYNNSDHEGYFVFTRPNSGGAGGSSSANFNPAVLGSSISATIGATATMNQVFNYSFQHSDNFMHIPYLERIAIRDRNKYALSPTGDATDVGTYSPLFTKNEYGSAWFKPYASFESVGLKNGPKVSNITYGSLVGFDTELESIKGGWDRVFTGYIGYNGASQRYSGVDSYQNGGLIGGTMTLYKGNFFNATTVSVGASVANNTNMYGNEDFAMLLSGIGNKTGYNFEFKEGKVILQPSMLMSYTFVNTFDYTNAAGVRIDNKPLHAIQLAPGVKLIGNTKNGWQPYVGVSMVWNLMGESDATANGVKLPEMSIKPYVQYGVGLQKRMKDNFMAFGQAMIQNGGRNGVSHTAGFRWAIGKR